MRPCPDEQDDPTIPSRSPLARGARAAGGVVVAALLTCAGAGLASADPLGAEDPGTTELSASQQERATDYWSEARMESATPADDLVSADEAPDGDGQVARSEVEQIDGVDAPPEGSTQDGAAVPSAATDEASTEPTASAAATSTDHIGKVFFTVDGSDYVCSGNSVASENGSTVSTAGHCAHEAGAWVSNWVFAPGYDEGEAPYGLWSASELFSTDQWIDSEDLDYDVAFAVVTPESGTASLEDTVGASGIEFNTERGALYTSFGYPAKAPFDGESLEQCQDTGSEDEVGTTRDQAIDCDMTGGSSGGPWFAGDGPTGYQISVNSFGYSSQAGVMYGPYLGDEAQETYEEAAAA